MDEQQVVVITKWGVRWLKHAWDLLIGDTKVERLAKELLTKLDNESGDPEEYVDNHVYVSTHTTFNKVEGEVLVGRVERKKCVLRKGRRSNFAASIAQLAYNKFGERKMSEANVLVTRKWIQKLLDGPAYKDLRTCDKNLAIDRALFLSFVPTDAFREMQLVVTSNTWKDRCDANTVFGKVFRLENRGGVSDGTLLELA